MRCRAAQHAGGVGGVCLQSARAVEATWNLRTAQGSNYELAALRSSAARALLVHRQCMYVCSYMESCWAAALQACARGAGDRWAEGVAAAHRSSLQKPQTTGCSCAAQSAVVEEDSHAETPSRRRTSRSAPARTRRPWPSAHAAMPHRHEQKHWRADARAES